MKKSVHTPETYWFHLPAAYRGRKQADMIISEAKENKGQRLTKLKLRGLKTSLVD